MIQAINAHKREVEGLKDFEYDMKYFAGSPALTTLEFYNKRGKKLVRKLRSGTPLSDSESKFIENELKKINELGDKKYKKRQSAKELLQSLGGAAAAATAYISVTNIINYKQRYDIANSYKLSAAENGKAEERLLAEHKDQLHYDYYSQCRASEEYEAKVSKMKIEQSLEGSNIIRKLYGAIGKGLSNISYANRIKHAEDAGLRRQRENAELDKREAEQEAEYNAARENSRKERALANKKWGDNNSPQ